MSAAAKKRSSRSRNESISHHLSEQPISRPCDSELDHDSRLRPESKLYLPHKLAATEKEIIEDALRESQGWIFGPPGAAAKLGIARSTLESKIQSLLIDKKRFKRQLGT